MASPGTGQRAGQDEGRGWEPPVARTLVLPTREGRGAAACFWLRSWFPGSCAGLGRWPWTGRGRGGILASGGARPLVLAGRTHNLPARRSRKVLPRPEDVQVPELGQSPGGRSAPRGSGWREQDCQQGRDWLEARLGGGEPRAWPVACDAVRWQPRASLIPRSEGRPLPGAGRSDSACPMGRAAGCPVLWSLLSFIIYFGKSVGFWVRRGFRSYYACDTGCVTLGSLLASLSPHL